MTTSLNMKWENRKGAGSGTTMISRSVRGSETSRYSVTEFSCPSGQGRRRPAAPGPDCVGTPQGFARQLRSESRGPEPRLDFARYDPKALADNGPALRCKDC